MYNLLGNSKNCMCSTCFEALVLAMFLFILLLNIIIYHKLLQTYYTVSYKNIFTFLLFLLF